MNEAKHEIEPSSVRGIGKDQDEITEEYPWEFFSNSEVPERESDEAYTQVLQRALAAEVKVEDISAFVKENRTRDSDEAYAQMLLRALASEVDIENTENQDVFHGFLVHASVHGFLIHASEHVRDADSFPGWYDDDKTTSAEVLARIHGQEMSDEAHAFSEVRLGTDES